MKPTRTLYFPLFLAVSVLLVSAIPASFAASSPTPKPKTSAKATAKPTVKAKVVVAKPIAKPKTPTKEVRGVNQFASLTTAQRGCLVKHGITIPAPRSSSAPRPTPNPTGSPGSFGGARGNFNPTKMAAAYKACGIKVPVGGFATGGQGAFNSAKFQAFQKCMVAAGITPTGGFGRYDQSDPSTVAALVKCQKSSGFTLPKPGQPGLNN